MDKELNESAIEQADRLFAEGQQLLEESPFSKSYDLFDSASKIYLEYEKWESYIQCLYRMANWKRNQQASAEAQKLVEEALRVYENKIKKQQTLLGNLYDLQATISFDQKQYENSLKQSKLALAVYQNLNDEEGIAMVYTGIGNYYNHTYRYQNSLPYYYKALKIQSRKTNKKSLTSTAYTYFNIAHTYRLLEYYNLSKSYLVKALLLFEEHLGTHNPITIHVKVSLAEIQAKLGEDDSAFQQYQETLAILQQQELAYDEISMILFYIGELYVKQGNWEQASDFFQQALDNHLQHNPENYEWLVFAYDNWLVLCLDAQKWEMVEECFQKGKEAIENLDINQNMFKARYYGYDAKSLSLQNKPREALFSIKKALKHCEKAQKTHQVFNLELLIELEMRHLQILFECFRAEQNMEYLQEAVQLFPNTYALIEEKQSSIFQEADQLIFHQYITQFYHLAINILYEQYSQSLEMKLQEETFILSEKNKVHSLLSTIQKAEALQLSAIPTKKLQELQQLQSRINYHQTLLQKADLETDSKTFDDKGEQFANLQVEYHQLFQQIEKEHPEYLELKHQMPSLQVKDLQSQLKTYQAAISYILGEEYLYILYIDIHTICLERTNLTEGFNQLLDSFIDEAILGMNRKAYVQKAHQLYQLLIAPIEEKLQGNQIESLLILPDSHLLELPFELLLTQATSFKTAYSKMPYLLKKYSITYHYSATLRQYQQQRNKDSKNLLPQFLGFAPVYDTQQFPSNVSEALPAEATRDVSIRGTHYKALLYSEQEVKDIEANFQQKGWQSQVFLRAKANLEEFKKNAQQTQPKYLHIAAHGVSNRRKNVLGILFSPDKKQTPISTDTSSNANPLEPRQQNASSTQSAILYAHELYQLKLKSDLVFLSCCESGVGKIAAGEGILSLNRGLLYAGVPNIVFTLFKIYDQKTAIFAHHFYDYLLNQEDNYAQALRYAKLQLLKEDLPPRYWGGFLLLGD